LDNKVFDIADARCNHAVPTRCLSGWWSENIIWDVLSVLKMTNARFPETPVPTIFRGVTLHKNLISHN